VSGIPRIIFTAFPGPYGAPLLCADDLTHKDGDFGNDREGLFGKVSCLSCHRASRGLTRPPHHPAIPAYYGTKLDLFDIAALMAQLLALSGPE
jgi:hypothetical protein